MAKLFSIITFLFLSLSALAATEQSMLHVNNGLAKGCLVNLLYGRCPARNSSVIIHPGQTFKLNMRKLNTITVYLHAELTPKKNCPIADKNLASKTYCLVVRDANVNLTLKRSHKSGQKPKLIFQGINQYHLCKENS